jgi:hypothetical protein
LIGEARKKEKKQRKRAESCRVARSLGIPWYGTKSHTKGGSRDTGIRFSSDAFAAVHAREKCFLGRLYAWRILPLASIEGPHIAWPPTSEQLLCPCLFIWYMWNCLSFFAILFSLLSFCKKKQRTCVEYLLRFIGWAWILIVFLKCRISSSSFYISYIVWKNH